MIDINQRLNREIECGSRRKANQTEVKEDGIERNQVVNVEVRCLLDVGLIRTVQYPEWLASMVIVKQKYGKWWKCVDFTNLNKACLKDSFSHPHNDRLVDATSGHQLLTLLDAFF